MTLATYKAIFFWEWVHRLLARTIGLVFALPFIIFWVRRQIRLAITCACSRCWRWALCRGRGMVDGQIGHRP
jgi:heme A synthase